MNSQIWDTGSHSKIEGKLENLIKWLPSGSFEKTEHYIRHATFPKINAVVDS